MLNLYQVQMFVAVVDTGSFSAAAEQLHVTQPAVSEGVRALEARLGTRLFERRGHRAAVTPEGAAFVPAARRLLDLADETEQVLLAGRGQVAGRLRLATATSAGGPDLARRLGAFLAAHPAASAAVAPRDRAGVLDGVLDGSFDAGFLIADPHHPRLLVRPFARDEWALLVPPGHPWVVPVSEDGSPPAKRKRGRPPLLRVPATPRLEQLADPAALRDVPLVLESAEGPLGQAARRELRDALEAVGVAWATLRPALEAGGPPDVVAAVEAGAGVGLLALSALGGYAGPAVRFRLAGHPLPRPCLAVRDSRATLSPVAAAWWQTL